MKKRLESLYLAIDAANPFKLLNCLTIGELVPILIDPLQERGSFSLNYNLFIFH
jgi:hypothetical protein